MPLSAFDDKANPPGNADLAEELGKSFILWNDLIERIGANVADVSMEWGYTSKSTGWGLRLKTAKRVVVYMTPCSGYFLASFALGEKAVKTAHQNKLPHKLLEMIDAAPKYAEGRAVRIPIKSEKDVRNVEKLAVIRMTT